MRQSGCEESDSSEESEEGEGIEDDREYDPEGSSISSSSSVNSAEEVVIFLVFYPFTSCYKEGEMNIYYTPDNPDFSIILGPE